MEQVIQNTAANLEAWTWLIYVVAGCLVLFTGTFCVCMVALVGGMCGRWRDMRMFPHIGTFAHTLKYERRSPLEE